MKLLKNKIDKILENEITEENYAECVAVIRQYPNSNKTRTFSLERSFKPEKVKRELQRISEKLAYHITNNPGKFQESAKVEVSAFTSAKVKSPAKAEAKTYDSQEALEKEKSNVIGEIRKASNSLHDMETDEERLKVVKEIQALETRLKELNKLTELPEPKIDVPDIAKLKQMKRTLQSYISRESKKIEKEEAKGKDANQKKLSSLYKKLKTFEDELLQAKLQIESIIQENKEN